jgi:ethanolamine ammonia-lyase small subunit
LGAVVTAPRKIAHPFWEKLRAATPARIGLERTGTSISTKERLAFQLAHAVARDAVHEPLDVEAVSYALSQRGFRAVRLRSAAADRKAFLTRPDLGRKLSEESRDALAPLSGNFDIVFAIADGLSARAISRHAAGLLDGVTPLFAPSDWRIGPVAVIEQGRVAIGDEIGRILGAKIVVVLIGERPGLTSPDSLGIYVTWDPKVGRNDAERNCLSNIRPEGMSYNEAARRLFYLCSEARRLGFSGVRLKDNSAPPRGRISLPVSKQGGGVLPGVDLNNGAALQEMDDLERWARSQ